MLSSSTCLIIIIFIIIFLYKRVVPQPLVQPKVNFMDILVLIEIFFSFLISL